VFVRSIFAGWLTALMVWLLPGAESVRVSSIIIVTYLVGISGFDHIIAGSTATFFLLIRGSVSWATYVVQFFLPTLMGNVIGGLSLVAALGHAQVVGREGTINFLSRVVAYCSDRSHRTNLDVPSKILNRGEKYIPREK
jgi:formate-nitrite transporter family protein